MGLFGSSGIRGVVNRDFTPELANLIGMAVGGGVGSAAVGMDSRTSGPMVEAAVSAGLMSVGCDVLVAGIVTTPTLAEAARTADLGIMITASHNPPEYAGIKLVNPDGGGFDVSQSKTIERLIESRKFKLQPWDKVGKKQLYNDAIKMHARRILRSVGKHRLKVVVDCANGPATTITPMVLRDMGCRVVTLNSNLDGHFPGRPPEPLEENLTSLKKAVISMKANLGIAHDGDADRMVAVDEKGEFLGGDTLLALFARRYAKKRLVVTVDASMAIDDFVKAEVIRTKVGDVFVSEEVKKRKAEFGGEPSGTWIFPDQSYCPDGILAAARLVEMAADLRLSEMRKKVPAYPIFKESVMYDPKLKQQILKRLAHELRGVDCEELLLVDGFRLQFENGWALVRPSGTEPKIRYMAEARTERRAKEIMSLISSKVKGCLK